MAGVRLDIAEITFFELDRLFTASAQALRRKQQRRRRQEKDGGEDVSRSRTPPPRRLFRTGRAGNITGFGGFTSAVAKVETTAVVLGVPLTADDQTLFTHFSKAGTVNDVKVVRTRYEKPTGTVIVEFSDEEAVNRACNMPSPHNQILGVGVVVKRADAQKQQSNPPPKRMMTRQQFTQQMLSSLKSGGGRDADTSSGPNMRKLHIKNLRPVVTEEDMRGIFKPFGEFEEFKMGSQECWITFVSSNDAQDAMGSMQGFQLVGQELVISLEAVAVKAPPSVPPPALPEPMDLKNDTDFGGGGGSNPMHTRIELMKKLMSSHEQKGVPTVVQGAPPATALPPTVKPGNTLSRTLLLQNMFSPSAVNLRKDPRFYEEIREDTNDECTKFGKVLHVTVDPRGSTGLIYVLYETPQQRLAAEMALNGRWFEGKKIVAMGIDDSIWQAMAKEASGEQGEAAAAAA